MGLGIQRRSMWAAAEPLEIVVNGWQEIGLNANIKEYDHNLYQRRGVSPMSRL